MKWVLFVLGLLLLLMGTVWILQGLGIYPVGFMAHQMKYAYAGIVLDVVGLGLVVLGALRRRKAPRD
jgi:hypothetical protein